ncbi:hypothetical protein SELMODRAFT_229029 [Selaginella moellendorffii]|uniref:Peroxisomal membrane protein PEX16 n=1 Tax=Selaginella moellendorffii TaxID=88036 RepID=D8SMB3_SELML|nr:peroxisome biogenesis protein 16 [Selaginella moellendorffii]EFJ14461.1 hypothetical protein SELMODRAFT_229029 [Selaginella moellendorffii]|eukprot:XP_002984411.1 peroxisome biogenesis protein 16 [Selaginella moellendorffii]
MEAYKAWVRGNRQWLASIESIATTMTWLLPERFASSELAPEALSTAIGLVTVMNQYIVESASPKNLPPFMRSGADDRDKSIPWPIFISIVKELEVLVELTAEHYRGPNGKWSTLAVVEAIKVLIRLKIFHDSGYKMLIDGGESENQEEASYCDPYARRGARTSGRPQNVQGKAMGALYSFGNSLSGRPSWLQKRDAAQQPVQRGLLSLWKQPAARWFIVGETSLILRPLIYVFLIRRYGLKSWKPWLASLAIDLTGFSILFLTDQWSSKSSNESLIISQGSPSRPLSAAEKNELKRRQLLWAFYLLRSPFFDTYSRHQFQRIGKVAKPLPLFGTLASKAMELLAGVQSIYSYTAAS